APGYGGPVPPGGWQQPIARPTSGWAGQPLASWGMRLGAWLIDWLVLLIPAVILFFVVVAGAWGVSGDDDASTGAVIGATILYVLLMSAVILLYAPLLMMRQGAHNGQTLGKQLLGIRVARDTGEPMGFGWAALREVVVKGLAVGIASSIIPIIPWFLNYFWPLWDDQNRALHDMAVSTHVIQT
ncbi:MAG: RDD family protein, partial [Thermoleophilaceae bacterium]